MKRLEDALDRLAALYEFGHLELATDAVDFIDHVINEIEYLRPREIGVLFVCPHHREEWLRVTFRTHEQSWACGCIKCNWHVVDQPNPVAALLRWHKEYDHGLQCDDEEIPK